MSDRSPDTKDTQPVATQNGEINPSRRKLTGAALGVSAIFTLASRPVLAQECITPSAAASGNMSHYGTMPPCIGQTAATWAGIDPNNYPAGTTQNPQFNTIFTNGTHSTWDNEKLDEVLDASNNANNSTKPNPISKEFTAALLNIRSNQIPASVLTEVGLIGMWNEWVASGVFTPKAGASWNATQIVTYLQGLQA